MRNKLYIDVETGGFDPKIHALLEVALIPVVDGMIQKHYVSKIKPYNGLQVTDGSLKVNKLYDYNSHPEESEVFSAILEFLEGFDTKFTLAGHNVKFDKKFFYSLFTRYGAHSDYYKYFRHYDHCTLEKAKQRPSIPCKNNLGALCEYFKIDLRNAHSALDDIMATIKLDEMLDGIEPGEKVFKHGKTPDSYSGKREKYLDRSYVMFNGDGDIFISKKASDDKEAMRFIVNELMEIYDV